VKKIIISLSAVLAIIMSTQGVESGSRYTKNDIKELTIIKQKLCVLILKYKTPRFWQEKDVINVTKVIWIGSKQYGINPNHVFATIALESYFNPYALGINKDSQDFGLTQQNSKYWKKRFKVAAKILTAYGIQHNLKNPYDTALNVMACILYKYNINKRVDRSKVKNTLYSKYVNKIVAYNLGINGARDKKKYKIGMRYYKIFRKKLKFCSL
jgi:hypothetical protein